MKQVTGLRLKLSIYGIHGGECVLHHEWGLAGHQTSDAEWLRCTCGLREAIYGKNWRRALTPPPDGGGA